MHENATGLGTEYCEDDMSNPQLCFGGLDIEQQLLFA
jgi:hypothetical protein